MKQKFFTVVLCVLVLFGVTGCPDPNNTPDTPTYGINPPEWLQGTWTSNEWLYGGTLEITNNNIIYTSDSPLASPEDWSQMYMLTDSVSGTVYTVTNHIGTGMSQSTVFTLDANNPNEVTVEFYSGIGTAIYTKTAN